MAIASLISICWLMFGYSLAFGAGRNNEYIGGSEKFWFWGVGNGSLFVLLVSYMPRVLTAYVIHCVPTFLLWA